MKDIGYYAGFLKPETQEAITNAPMRLLTDCLDDVTNDLNLTHYLSLSNSVAPPIKDDERLIQPLALDSISDRDKLALIRGLCDRIELKLMEAAK